MSRLTINSNIASLNAQRRFGQATSKLNESFTRLSSGLRINKASDDAAGLSVSSLLTADKRVTNVGIRNINDGISYLNVAESALSELSNIVTRISELAEQSANGTFGSSQRDALQQEVTSLESEYNRIIKTTSFNGNQLLTGTTTNTILQGGYGVAGQLGVQVGDASLGIVGDETRAGETTQIQDALVSGYDNFASDDGRYYVFSSNSTTLVPGDTNGKIDVFIRDILTGDVIRASTDSSGIQADGNSAVKSISPDGRFIVFTSGGSNLVSNDTNGTNDIFMKDTLTGKTTLISADRSGNVGNLTSSSGFITPDGRYVGFDSVASNLVIGDTNGTQDSFLKDTITGITTRISTDSFGNEANAFTYIAGISADGRYVAFYSDATNLVAGDTNGVRDSFIKDTLTGITSRISTDSSGTQGNANSEVSGISADGRFVVFQSLSTNLVAGDTNANFDVFLKDTLTGVTTRISTDGSSNQANGSSSGGDISADGRFVVFTSSATDLVTGDINGRTDVFIKDTLTGLTTLISKDSSGNQYSVDSGKTSISSDGRYVAYGSFTKVYVRDLSKTGVQEISGMVVSNQASARVTLDLSKKYQAELSKYQAGIGASLSRATTFVNTLQVQSENYAAAASQITDVDVAEESSKLTASQIIQQAAASVLKQANLQPQLVLSLLKGL